jgi:hypothetical protein
MRCFAPGSVSLDSPTGAVYSRVQVTNPHVALEGKSVKTIYGGDDLTVVVISDSVAFWCSCVVFEGVLSKAGSITGSVY